jgi:hypothetical protein
MWSGIYICISYKSWPVKSSGAYPAVNTVQKPTVIKDSKHRAKIPRALAKWNLSLSRAMPVPSLDPSVKQPTANADVVSSHMISQHEARLDHFDERELRHMAVVIRYDIGEKNIQSCAEQLCATALRARGSNCDMREKLTVPDEKLGDHRLKVYLSEIFGQLAADWCHGRDLTILDNCARTEIAQTSENIQNVLKAYRPHQHFLWEYQDPRVFQDELIQAKWAEIILNTAIVRAYICKSFKPSSQQELWAAATADKILGSMEGEDLPSDAWVAWLKAWAHAASKK